MLPKDKSSQDVFVATESGVCELPGASAPFVFRRGVTKVRAGHPILKACPAYFEPAIYTETSDGTLRG